MIIVEDSETIRTAYHLERKSIRQIARERHRSRRRMRKAPKDIQPQPFQHTRPKPAPVFGSFQGRDDTLLAQNETLPKKQRYTWNFIDKLMCFFGIHQGEWTTKHCQQRRFCIYCGKRQKRERHNWPPKDAGRYFKDGSCEMRIRCLGCGKIKSIGIRHEGAQHEDEVPWLERHPFDPKYCKRCGEDLSPHIQSTWICGKHRVQFLYKQLFRRFVVHYKPGLYGLCTFPQASVVRRLP